MSATLKPSSPDEVPARYAVGIDLGTTHSALAYVDLSHGTPVVRDLPIPQWVAAGEIEGRAVLPSFAYEPGPGEFPSGAFTIPGTAAPAGWVVGWFARQHGALNPGRLITSAKSWLCHPGVNRTAPLLPWQGAPEATRLSPVEATARFLQHLRGAWDAAFPAHPLAAQEVVLTVPASFDEVARELTVRAAEKAGLPSLSLLEEPQAAFYAWMAAHRETAETTLGSGRRTLICDVGGGTTDFTLIEARPAGEGQVRFHRVAVGEHLLLGGDNMDLALAHAVEPRLNGGARLDPRRWGALVQACRLAKETLLRADAPDRLGISVAGGARLIGGALQTELVRDEVRALLIDGFLPRVPLSARPAAAKSGFKEFGLPYAADAAITRHLAAFLSRFLAQHRNASADTETVNGFPDRVLFNGGVFEAACLRDQLLEVLQAWRGELGGDASGPLTVLPNERLDLAVARGAAYSGFLKREPGRRIAAGLARAYYVEVGARDAGRTAVCLAPAGLEEGEEVVVPQKFVLRLREPVEFALFTSSTRTQDRIGDRLAIDPLELMALPPLRTVVSTGRARGPETAEVELHARLTPIGTLDLSCVQPAPPRSWKLEFDVRGAAPGASHPASGLAPAAGAAIEQATLDRCRERLRRVFDPASGDPGDPARLTRALEEVAGLGRHEWPLPLLRAQWEAAMALESGRRRSPLHEARWLNLVGFALRPGFGHPVDDWRVQQTWRLFASGTAFPRNEMCRAEWCILWRRVAGGLGTGHQRALADAFAPVFRGRGGKRPHYGAHETSEIWRLLASLEWLPVPVKVEIGVHLLERCDERRLDRPLQLAASWALGRLGVRVPVYATLDSLVPAETAEQWLRRVLTHPSPDSELLFAAVQLARRTGDRHRDLGETARGEVLAWLERHHAPAMHLQLVKDGGDLDTAEEAHVVGESLPPGLHLPHD